MLKIYYKICADTIFKSQNTNNGDWKFVSITFLSGFLSLILISLTIIITKIIPEHTYFSIYPENYTMKSLDIKLESIVVYFIPSVIINYFLIIYNKKHEKLLVMYKPQNGSYMIRFMIFSLVFFLVTVFIM
ncbi:hypothetical protein SAMN04487979_11918 [Flavobacterium sp. ov086]|nr:hypothetical protein SAMN04487979_11918 [Flavobacterium sp. ov086]